MVATSSVMASTSQLAFRLSPDPAPFASPALSTSRSGISSISITIRSAAIASRISPSLFALTWYACRPSQAAGQENGGACSLQLQGPLDLSRQALLHGRFTQVLAEICSGGAARRPSQSKSLALLRRIISPDA